MHLEFSGTQVCLQVPGSDLGAGLGAPPQLVFRTSPYSGMMLWAGGSGWLADSDGSSTERVTERRPRARVCACLGVSMAWLCPQHSADFLDTGSLVVVDCCPSS